MTKNKHSSVISTIFSKPYLGILILFTLVSLLNIPVLITMWRHGFDDGTYSHAFLIPFISLYLYYLLAESGQLQFRKKLSLLPTALLIISCYLLFVTTNAQISVGYWGALLAVFITSVTMLYRFNWYIIFPAAFLIFIFPFWGALAQPLQSLSVLAVTYLMSFTGVPVFVEATYITVPAGVFEVAGGCSGLRYLIVSLAISSLFIFLNISKAKNAFLFLLVAILGALLTNWIRITALVLIGQYTNMESSLMTDHNAFGWYLYIPFMVSLFIWGNKIADRDLITLKSIQSSSAMNKHSNVTLWLFFLTPLFLSSTSIKLFFLPKSHEINLNTNSVSNLSPDIYHYSSLKIAPNINSTGNVEHRIYTFDGRDLDGKPTFFENNLIPKGWTSSKKSIINGRLKQNITNGHQHAILFTHFEIDGEVISDRKTFKIKRLTKAILGVTKTTLHWSMFICAANCLENTLPSEFQ
jgi:exosortase A